MANSSNGGERLRPCRSIQVEKPLTGISQCQDKI